MARRSGVSSSPRPPLLGLPLCLGRGQGGALRPGPGKAGYVCATVRRLGDEVTSKRPCGAGDRPLGAPRPHLPGSKHPLRSGAVGGPALCLDTPVGSTPVVGRGSSVSLGAQASWVASWGGPGQEGRQPRPWAAGLPPTEDSASGGPGSFPAAFWPGAADRARGMLPRSPAGRPGLGLWAEQAPSPGAAIPVPGVPPLCPWPAGRGCGQGLCCGRGAASLRVGCSNRKAPGPIGARGSHVSHAPNLLGLRQGTRTPSQEMVLNP